MMVIKKWFVLGIVIIATIFGGCSSYEINDSFETHEGPNYYQRIGMGLEEGTSSIHKFGSGDVGTTPSLISQTGTYLTPMTPANLEFVSNNALDNVLGTGAREITIIGLDADWKEQTAVISTNGTTPVQLPGTWFRVYRWYVSKSGTYATPSSASYVGDLEIRGTGGGTVWTTITSSPTTTGQSQIGAFTIPKCKTGYLIGKNLFVDSTRPADVYFFFRDNADDLTAPYNGVRRIIEREVGVAGGFNREFQIPKGPFIGPTDIGFFGSVTSGSGTISVEFELYMVDIEGCI